MSLSAPAAEESRAKEVSAVVMNKWKWLRWRW